MCIKLSSVLSQIDKKYVSFGWLSVFRAYTYIFYGMAEVGITPKRIATDLGCDSSSKSCGEKLIFHFTAVFCCVAGNNRENRFWFRCPDKLTRNIRGWMSHRQSNIKRGIILTEIHFEYIRGDRKCHEEKKEGNEKENHRKAQEELSKRFTC